MNTKALRQKILDLAIHGKLVPQNPKDESATVLLEKIRAEKAEKIKQGELKANKKDSFIFVGSDKRHYEQFADGTLKDIEDEIPFDVPEGWAWCRIKEVCTIVMGSSPDGKSVSESTNGKEFHQGKIYFTDKYLNESNSFTSEVTKIAPINSLLLCVRAPVGIVNITQREICIGRGLCCLFPNYEIDIDFWFYWMQFFKNDFETKATGTTFKAISVDIVKSQLIPIPPMEEQIKIVKTIDNLFEKIDSLNKNTLDLQTAIKQAKSKILDLAIHGKLVPQDPNDEPAVELLKRIATSDNRPYEKVGEEPFEIPHSWKWVRLGSVCDYGKCINVSTSDLRANDWILDLEDIEKDSGKILAFHTLKERKSESTKHKFTKGQVLYSKLRPYLNKVVIAPKDGFCTSEILPLDFNEILLNRFAQIVLMSSYFLTLVNMVTYGVKMPRLGTGDAKNMLIPIPPLNEQKCIVSKIDELFSNLDQIQNNLI